MCLFWTLFTPVSEIIENSQLSKSSKNLVSKSPQFILNRLLCDQSAYEGRKHFFERCLHGFKRELLLEKHKPVCRGINQAARAIEMPKPGTEQAKICFENHH